MAPVVGLDPRLKGSLHSSSPITPNPCSSKKRNVLFAKIVCDLQLSELFHHQQQERDLRVKTPSAMMDILTGNKTYTSLNPVDLSNCTKK
ncbi:hypothetical protein PoB_003732100 [Plakobranchus ocellatus]|uniref:Uncharacterized protein n=1 Tax=Plakobranchus ocellatus TaxID=259542 RepID=A0AAV4AWB9_9GAST|nr:hypothetical protein PoB_003732100 [Plakobranchus ocellatus]